MDSPKRIRSRQLDGVFQKVLGLWFGNALKESWLWSLCQFQWRIKSHVFRIPTKNRENKESFRPKPVRCGSNSNGNHIFPIADTIFIFFTVWCSSSPQTAWWSGNFFGVCVCVCRPMSASRMWSCKLCGMTMFSWSQRSWTPSTTCQNKMLLLPSLPKSSRSLILRYLRPHSYIPTQLFLGLMAVKRPETCQVNGLACALLMWEWMSALCTPTAA